MANDTEPLRVLFLCTGNSARSQMAEAVLRQRGGGRFIAGSAGSTPAAQVHSRALAALEHAGHQWSGHPPQSWEDLPSREWDFVITVCDRARETCPVFPGSPLLAHWGMPDPAAVTGSDADQQRAFEEALFLLTRRIDLLLALPFEKLKRRALELRVQAIGEDAET
jgi:protein-tyrosine-phosphatase